MSLSHGAVLENRMSEKKKKKKEPINVTAELVFRLSSHPVLQNGSMQLSKITTFKFN